MDKRIEKILKTDAVARNRIDKAKSFAKKTMKNFWFVISNTFSSCSIVKLM